METAALQSLPTTAVALIAFISLLYVGSMGWMVRFFFNYIQNKNGYMERQSQLFAKTMEEYRTKFEQMLNEQGERHRAMLEEAHRATNTCLSLLGK